jgi:hypothetical protein
MSSIGPVIPKQMAAVNVHLGPMEIAYGLSYSLTLYQAWLKHVSLVAYILGKMMRTCQTLYLLGQSLMLHGE